MAAQPATRMTAEEFERDYLDAFSIELVNGRVVELMPGGADHGLAVSNATGILRAWANKSRKGRVFAGEVGIITQRKPDSVRGADVAYYSFKRLARGKRPSGFFSLAPDLAVEVLGIGKGWDAALKKASEYLSAGAARAWILAPRGRTLHGLSADAPPRQLTHRDVIRDPGVLPGFSCKVAEFFSE